ncbi:MAG: response regulator transcription factor [Gemmatimonadaceae bacterium]
MTRVAIVAAAAAVRDRLAAIVGASDSVTIAAAVASIDALDSAPGLASSDVVLLHAARIDIAVRELHRLPPIPVVVLLGRAAGRARMQAILGAGVRGVLPDDATRDELAAAVEAAAAGFVVVPPELVTDLVNAPAVAGEANGFAAGTDRSATRAPALTPREREILAMLADGLPNKLIASRAGISEHTVKTHLEAIFEKLGASTRAEAVARAVRSGLLLL